MKQAHPVEYNGFTDSVSPQIMKVWIGMMQERK
jgi:hypothetical protein